MLRTRTSTYSGGATSSILSKDECIAVRSALYVRDRLMRGGLSRYSHITAMSPRQFLETVVRPNIRVFHDNFADQRHAYNAISAIDALAAHLYFWASANAPAAVVSDPDDTYFRGSPAKRDPQFALLRDIAKAQKHVHLRRGSPQVTSADQISARPLGYGEAQYGLGRYGGGAQVVVDIAPGEVVYVESIVDDGLAFLETEMTALGA